MKTVLFEDFRDKFELEVPLTSVADVPNFKKSLGFPEHVDVEDYIMRRLVVSTWAARNVNAIRERVPEDLRKKLPEKPIDIAFFGGAAFRLLCRDSNRNGPFYRDINDLDVVTTSQRGAELVNVLSALGQVFGTEYFHFVTTSDRFFNHAMRPKRFRIHAINGLRDRAPIAGEMDIFCDRIAMCHTVDVRDELKSSQENGYTIGLEKLLLTKLQFIKRIPKEVVNSSNEYRIIQELDKNTVVVGLEDKDFIDVVSAFYDYDVEEVDQISIRTIYNALTDDGAMCKTVLLNFQSILKNLSRLNLPVSHTSVVEQRIRKLLKELPEPKTKGLFGPKKQWWTTVEE